jgi:glycine hydroxymethyltransferase
MRESEMKEVARLISRVVNDRSKIEKVKAEVRALKKDFTKIHYCLGEGARAYEYYDFL